MDQRWIIGRQSSAPTVRFRGYPLLTPAKGAGFDARTPGLAHLAVQPVPVRPGTLPQGVRLRGVRPVTARRVAAQPFRGRWPG